MYCFYKNSTILSLLDETTSTSAQKKGKQMKNHLLTFLIS